MGLFLVIAKAFIGVLLKNVAFQKRKLLDSQLQSRPKLKVYIGIKYCIDKRNLC